MAQRKSLRISRRAMEIMNDDDRISQLPDGVIHHIFSFMDTRSVVQSSRLSRRWRNTWKSHPYLNFEITPSPDRASGTKFPNPVHRFLSRRDDVTELSTVKFWSNSIRLPLLREIIIYAMSHSTRKLKIEFLGDKLTRCGGLDLSLFRSQHLEHLFLSIDFRLIVSPPLTWDFPALTTLSIKHVTFTLELPNEDASKLKSIDLFSQFPNLKPLTLDDCILSNIDTFIIKSSELESLSLINLVHLCEFVVSAPKLSSFTYNGAGRFSLSAKNLLSLKTVNFQTIYHRSLKRQPEVIELFISTFKQLYKAESLTLNLHALRVLFLFPELRNCPFMNLQSLTLVSRRLPLPSTLFACAVSYFNHCSPDLKLHIKIERTPSRIQF